jgi:hypothetical protein
VLQPVKQKRPDTRVLMLAQDEDWPHPGDRSDPQTGPCGPCSSRRAWQRCPTRAGPPSGAGRQRAPRRPGSPRAASRRSCVPSGRTPRRGRRPPRRPPSLDPAPGQQGPKPDRLVHRCGGVARARSTRPSPRPGTRLRHRPYRAVAIRSAASGSAGRGSCRTPQVGCPARCRAAAARHPARSVVRGEFLGQCEVVVAVPPVERVALPGVGAPLGGVLPDGLQQLERQLAVPPRSMVTSDLSTSMASWSKM